MAYQSEGCLFKLIDEIKDILDDDDDHDHCHHHKGGGHGHGHCHEHDENGEVKNTAVVQSTDNLACPIGVSNFPSVFTCGKASSLLGDNSS